MEGEIGNSGMTQQYFMQSRIANAITNISPPGIRSQESLETHKLMYSCTLLSRQRIDLLRLKLKHLNEHLLESPTQRSVNHACYGLGEGRAYTLIFGHHAQRCSDRLLVPTCGRRRNSSGAWAGTGDVCAGCAGIACGGVPV